MREIVDIIADDVMGELISEDEQAYLKEWRASSAGNETFYSAMAVLKEQRTVMRKRTKPDLLFQAMEKKIGRCSRRRRLLRYSTAAGILLAIGVSFFLFDSKTQRSFPAQQQIVQLSSGKQRAELTLANGRKMQLDSGSQEVIISDSLSKVTNHNNTLVYSSPIGQHAKAGEFHVIHVPPGAEYNLLLADGTKVHLNSGSDLRYPVAFSGNQREVFLTGEAYFEVAHDQVYPFIVQADQLRIRVLGTSFNVTAYPGRDNIATTLEKGRIQIQHQERNYNVTPGEQAVWDKISGQLTIKKVETEFFTSWKDGYYYFDNTALEEIMTTLALWYNMEIFYQNPVVKNLRFGGRFKRYEDINYLFKRFAETNDVEFIVKDKYVTIKSK